MKTVIGALLLIFGFAPVAVAKVTLEFDNPFIGGIPFNLANAAGTPTNGMRWGIVVDTSNNGFANSSVNYDAYAGGVTTAGFLSAGGSVTDDYYIPGAVTIDASNIGAQDVNGVTPQSGCIFDVLQFALGNGVAAGQKFALVWFSDNTSVSGSRYGFLTDASFIVPADGNTDYFDAVFINNNPVRPASKTFGVSLPAAQISVFSGSGTGGSQQTDNTGVVNFPTVVVNTSSSAQTFTIENTGGSNLTGIAVTKALTGNPADFTVNTSGMATTLAANATTTFTVTFSPTALGSRSAVVQIASNDATTPSFRINVAGTAVATLAPQVSVFDGSGTGGNQRADNAAAFSFPPTQNSGISSPQTFTIENTGSANLTGLALTKAVSGNPTDFLVDTTGMATTLAPNATTSFTVTFSPVTTGILTAVVQIASNDPNVNPFRVNVSGSSVAVLGPQISVFNGNGTSPPARADGGTFSFSNTSTGSSSAPQVFTLQNTGTADLTGLAITEAVTGHPGDFAVDTTGMATTLASGATTSFTVTFSPSSTGIRTAVVQIASNDPNINPFRINVSGPSGAPQIAVFSGTGLGATAVADSGPVSFATTPTGSSSAQTFTIQNTGSLDLTSLAITNAVTGNPNDFVVSAPGVTTLAPNATTTFTVTFSPTATGPRAAVVQIASNDSHTNPFHIAVSGQTNTVSFNTSAQSVIEHAATVTVPVTLSSAAGLNLTKGFTVPVTYGGTATKVVNYTASPASTLTFAANKTVANLTVTVIDDKIVTANKTVTITLGTPSLAGVTLGTPAVFTLTFLDADTAPVISPVPVTQLVKVGDPVTFTSGVSMGSNPLTYQWKKNGVAIAGATSTTYTLPAPATLANSGAYTFTATNYHAAVTSTTAQLGVVDTTSSTQRLNLNTTATLTVNCAGTGLTWQWQKGGVPLPATNPTKYAGVNTKTLLVKTLVAGDFGDYTCVVSLPGASAAVTSGTFTLDVATASPTPTVPAFPDCVVYNAYSYQLPYDSMNESQVPTKFTCTGLPPGLVCNSATGMITGKATTPGTYSNIKVTLTNAQSTGVPTSTTGQIRVLAFPSTCVGTYVGWLARDATVTSNLGGRVDLLTTATGSFTGTLRLGASSYPLAGTMMTAPWALLGATSHPGITLTIARPGTTSVLLTLNLDPDTNELTGSAGPLSISNGWRNVWHTTNTTANPANPAPQAATTHSFSLTGSGAAGTPQGFGYGTIAVTSAGGTTVLGHTADGGAISCAGVLGPNGEVVVYQLLYSNKGSVLGNIGIASDAAHTVSGTLDWKKNAAVVARDYAAFGPVALTVTGTKYVVTTPVLNFDPVTNPTRNAQLVFDLGGLGVSLTNPNVLLTIGSTNLAYFPASVAGPGNPNPGKITAMTLTSTGGFSGKFTLTDGLVIRTVSFQGQLVCSPTPLAKGNGYGYFLLPQLADSSAIPPTTAANSPILSGSVVLQP